MKLNAKILRELKMISFGNSSAAQLTEFGKFIFKTLDSSQKTKGGKLYV
ncbi:MAG TPA: hypothetical protein VI933_02355 [archaeon]|nr:hypothetical protein [archaeon]